MDVAVAAQLEALAPALAVAKLAMDCDKNGDARRNTRQESVRAKVGHENECAQV